MPKTQSTLNAKEARIALKNAVAVGSFNVDATGRVVVDLRNHNGVVVATVLGRLDRPIG